MSRCNELDNVVERDQQAEKLAPPQMYKVILNNDDFTPMDFVIDVLVRFFSMTTKQAEDVMLAVHLKGKGICGVFTFDIAETKAAQVNRYARESEHPLLCSTEAA